MAKRLLDNISNNNIVNKKVKLVTDYDKWDDILRRILEKSNAQREIIKKKYELEDFTDKEDIDHRIYYGGVTGNRVFHEMYQTVISVELDLFFKYVLKATKPNSDIPLVKSSICHSLLKLLGTERKEIAKLTKTYKYCDFGLLSIDSHKYDYLCDQIDVWPSWHSMFLRKMKTIFEIYELPLLEQPAFYLDNIPIKYLLKNKNDSTKVVTFIVKREMKNMYRCYLTAGDKFLTDHKHSNLSSVIFSWICHAEKSTSVYPLIMANIDKWNNRDVLTFTDEEKASLGVPLNPCCRHKSGHESTSKVFDPLYSAILWNDKMENNGIVNLKMHLKQFYWQISHSTIYYRGQAAISKWIVEFICKRHGLGLNNLSFHVQDNKSDIISEVMVDQYALLCLFEDEFDHDFVKVSL